MTFLDILPYFVFLAIVIACLGFWLSLPDGVPLAPPQSFIDALPSWLQGPRRRVAAPNDMFSVYDEALSHRTMPLPNDAPAPGEESQSGAKPADVHEDVQSEAVQPEVIHDEP